MDNLDEMLEVLERYDDNDYDVTKELIPLVYHDAFEEYNKDFHFGDYNKDDLKYLILERIFWFLIDYAEWSETVDINIITEIVYEYYEK